MHGATMKFILYTVYFPLSHNLFAFPYYISSPVKIKFNILIPG